MSKKFVLAPDSFKESMSAKKVCESMAKGITKIYPDAEIIEVPMADGGEGTVDAIVTANNGQEIYINVLGPDGKNTVKAKYGFIPEKNTAVIEMAQASGLELLDKNERNPLLTTTFGTGQLVKNALDRGAKRLIIGLGGSATNDGGAGMAQALGVHFFDKNKNELPLGGGFLDKLSAIDITDLDQRLNNTQIILASDVTNPLTGPNGASQVFGPQKGANEEMVKTLDNNLHHYAEIIKQTLNKDIENIPGSGAAGGLGAGFLAFANSTIRPGAQIVIEENDLPDKIATADYVFTGEGGMDFQTKFGKTPFAVAQVAKKYNVPVYAVAGNVGKGIDSLYNSGFTAIFGILKSVGSLNDALKNGEENVTFTCENIARVIKSLE